MRGILILDLTYVASPDSLAGTGQPAAVKGVGTACVAGAPVHVAIAWLEDGKHVNSMPKMQYIFPAIHVANVTMQ